MSVMRVMCTCLNKIKTVLNYLSISGMYFCISVMMVDIEGGESLTGDSIQTNKHSYILTTVDKQCHPVYLLWNQVEAFCSGHLLSKLKRATKYQLICS